MPDICKILKENVSVAVVGISRNPNKTSRRIADYLVANNYKVVGVNPSAEFNDANGIPVYNSLTEITHKIDIVDVFRRSEDVPSILNDTLKIKPNVLWLQLGISNTEVRKIAEENGIIVIEDACILVEHQSCF